MNYIPRLLINFNNITKYYGCSRTSGRLKLKYQLEESHEDSREIDVDDI